MKVASLLARAMLTIFRLINQHDYGNLCRLFNEHNDLHFDTK